MKTTIKRSSIIIIAAHILVLSAFWCVNDSNANEDVSIPDNMEIIREGDVGVLVPKGGRMRKESSFLVKEDPEDYASRKFMATEERLDKITKEIVTIKDDMKSMREMIDGMKSDISKGNQKTEDQKPL